MDIFKLGKLPVVISVGLVEIGGRLRIRASSRSTALRWFNRSASNVFNAFKSSL